MGYRWLTVLIVLLHFGFLAYLTVGGFLAWRWPVTFWTHLATAAWGALVVLATLPCPLTRAEDWSRQRAGQPVTGGGFIDRYVEGVVYPERYSGAVRLLVVLLVAASWAGLFRRWSTLRRARAVAAGR